MLLETLELVLYKGELIMNKRCTNCDRFPFCQVQNLCIYNATDSTKSYVDYWIKRQDKEINKNG